MVEATAFVPCEEVPGLTAFVDDVVVTVEDGDGELLLAQIASDVLDRIELGCVVRQVQKPEVTAYDVDENGMRAGRNLAADLGPRQGQDLALASTRRLLRRVEDVGLFILSVPFARKRAVKRSIGPLRKSTGWLAKLHAGGDHADRTARITPASAPR